MEEYKQWIKQAQEDLRWTENSLEGEIWYGACFSAQQAVEKALKAYLIAKNKPLRKIHDVVGLLKDCSGLDDDFNQIEEFVQSVYPYYVETRYPAYEEIDIYTQKQAEEAYEHALKVVEFVKSKLNQAD